MDERIWVSYWWNKKKYIRAASHIFTISTRMSLQMQRGLVALKLWSCRSNLLDGSFYQYTDQSPKLWGNAESESSDLIVYEDSIPSNWKLEWTWMTELTYHVFTSLPFLVAHVAPAQIVIQTLWGNNVVRMSLLREVFIKYLLFYRGFGNDTFPHILHCYKLQ